MGHRSNAAPTRYPQSAPAGTFHPSLIEDGLTGLEIMLPALVYWFQERRKIPRIVIVVSWCTRDDTLIG